MDERFQANGFSGTGTLSIQISVTPARHLTPAIAIHYSSAGGAGAFGLGMVLSLGSITRRTSQGVPAYDDDDIFLLNGTPLTPSTAFPLSRTIDGIPYVVQRFVPRTETHAWRIERWRPADDPARDFWRLLEPDGRIRFYGLTGGARIADPGNTARVFSWLEEQEIHPGGEAILVRYKAEDGHGVGLAAHEQGRVPVALYPAGILYGNRAPIAPGEGGLTDLTGQDWFYEVIFDYGEYDLSPTNPTPHVPSRPWTARPDPSSRYDSGFERRTHRLCRTVIMVHRFPDERAGESVLVRTTALRYNEDPPCSRLIGIRTTGWRFQPGALASCYTRKSLPETTLAYTACEPLAQCFLPVRQPTGKPLPDLGDGQIFVDLDGNGVPGILSREHGALRFWSPMLRPEGVDGFEIVFAEDPARSAPSGADVARLTDFDGSGQLAWLSDTSGGYFAQDATATSGWGPYTPLEHVSLGLEPDRVELVDLSGTGRADLVTVGTDGVSVRASLGRHGYCPSVTHERPADMPVTGSATRTEKVGFADLLGAGSIQRFRIRSGSVEVWPSLGGGRFGPSIALSDAPRFDESFDPDRLFLADLDGSGPADLIYTHSDRIAIYANLGGNGFADSATITTPTPIDHPRQVAFVDLTGAGHALLLRGSGYAGDQCWACDVTAGRKPYLLARIDNGCGAQSHITYASSSEDALRDRAAGRPWVTRIPFPVQVVRRIEVRDRIAGSVTNSRFAYRHGYYDVDEREFRGFGFVERTEEGATDCVAIQSFVHRTWSHTGNWTARTQITTTYASEFDASDPAGLPQPATVFEPDALSVESEREAFVALAGLPVRTELVRREGGRDILHSVALHGHAVVVQQSPTLGERGRAGSFFVREREVVDALYDGATADPRVGHDMVLAIDAEGNPLRTINIAYGRRAGSPCIPEQLAGRTICEVTDYLPTRDEPDLWLSGLVSDERGFSINLDAMPSPASAAVYDFDAIAAFVSTSLSAPIVVYGGAGYSDATLLGWSRAVYGGEGGGETPGSVPTPQALLLRTETAVLADSVLRVVFDQPPPGGLDAFLVDAGGYRHDPSSGLWFAPSGTVTYGKREQFFQPLEMQDAFAAAGGLRSGTKTSLGYACDWLILIASRVSGSTSDVQPQATIVEAMDYAGLRPRRLRDANGIITEVALDPLGQVVATSHSGVEWRQGQAIGTGFTPLGDERWRTWPEPADLDKVLADPGRFLQGAASYSYVDDGAYLRDGRAVGAVNLQAVDHVDPSAPDTVGAIRITVVYRDGHGRIAQQRVLAEPGDAVLCDATGAPMVGLDGKLPIGPCAVRWRCSGRIAYDELGNPQRAFKPYAASTYRFPPALEAFDVLSRPEVFVHDALGRTIQAFKPAGGIEDAVFAQMEYGPWSQTAWDENDTIARSRLWAWANGPVDPATVLERNAVEAARVCIDTPTTVQFDPAGRTVRVIERLDAATVQPDLTTVVRYSVQGFALSIADPRLSALGLVNVSTIHDLAGAPLFVRSADAGPRWEIRDVVGSVIYQRDGRGCIETARFDSLHRRIETIVTVTDPVSGLALGNATTLKRIVFGDSLDATGHVPPGVGPAANCVGRPVAAYDEAGLTEAVAYTITGELAASRRRCGNPKGGMDWSWGEAATWAERFAALAPMLPPDAAAPDGVGFVSVVEHNALGEETSVTGPLGDREWIDYGEGGLPRDRGLALAGEARRPLVRDLTYDHHGRLLSIAYVNRDGRSFARAERGYDADSGALKTLVVTRTSDGKSLQDMTYWHDPIGHVTRIEDRAAPMQQVFFDQQQVTPVWEFGYDALGRLVQDTGRALRNLISGAGASGSYAPYFGNAQATDMTALDACRRSYVYDSGGNLTSTSFFSPTSRWTQTFKVSATSNRAIPVDDLATGADVDPSFDANGNQTRLGRLEPLLWNARNQLAKVTLVTRDDGAADDEAYLYASPTHRERKVATLQGAGGQRVEDNLDLGPIHIRRVRRNAATVEDLRRLRVDFGDHVTMERLTWVTGGPPDGVADGQERYQFGNLQGSASLEVDGDGRLISYEEYAPHGATVFASGRSLAEVDLKRFRYSGKERDRLTGLYFYGARYYCPWTGRWLSPDPAGLIDGPNLYAFVEGDPINHVDDDGMGKTKPNKKKKPINAAAKNKKRSFDLRGSHQDVPPAYEKLKAVAGNIGKSFASNLNISINDLNKIDSKLRAIQVNYGLPTQDDNKIEKAVEYGLTGDRKFADAYREAAPGMDEQFSTSTMAQVLKVVGGSNSIGSKSIASKTIHLVVRIISRMRMRTDETGYNDGTYQVQHPTGAGKGFWGTTGLNHNRWDRMRADLGLSSKTSAVFKGAMRLLSHGLEAALVSVNAFIMPATASNAHTENGITLLQKDQQTVHREGIKEMIMNLGGELSSLDSSFLPLSQSPNPQSKRSKSTADHRRRGVSPARTLP